MFFGARHEQPDFNPSTRRLSLHERTPLPSYERPPTAFPGHRQPLNEEPDRHIPQSVGFFIPRPIRQALWMPGIKKAKERLGPAEILTLLLLILTIKAAFMEGVMVWILGALTIGSAVYTGYTYLGSRVNKP